MKKFLAIYVGTEAALERSQWNKLDEEKRKAREAQGMQAWMDWGTTHAAAIVDVGNPLGKTKRAAPEGLTDIKNVMAGYVIIQAESHEAAANFSRITRTSRSFRVTQWRSWSVCRFRRGDERMETRTDTASIVVSATADRVYRAFADPEALMAWLPPGNMSGRVLEYDFREGGRYRIELTYDSAAPAAVGKTSGRTDVSAGLFRSLEPGKRIVQSVEFESEDASFAGEMVLTWSFEPVPTGTLVTISAENVPPGISKADHDAGLRASLENLARYVSGR